MKKYISLGVGIALLISPVFASAQTASASSNASLIATLTALVQTLESELQALLATHSPASSSATTASTSPSTSAPLFCAEYSNLTRGDTDATTGGQVSQLQADLGINPATGYYGAQTQIGYNNKCVGGNSQPTSVAGMSQYTDSNFGFSFWYPSEWTASKVSGESGDNSQAQIIVRDASNNIQFVLYESDVSYAEDAGHGSPEEEYYFDPNAGVWTYATYSSTGQKVTEPANTSTNTMGGLHMFTWSSVQSSCEVVIPLSAQNFVYVTSNNCTFSVNPIAQTIVATNANVATPVSTAQQTAIIQSEASTYGASTSNGMQTSVSTGAQSTVSGMNQYIDSTYGFSFWYPSSWTVSQLPVTSQAKSAFVQNLGGALFVQHLQISGGSQQNNIDMAVVNFPTSSITVPSAGCNATYSFNSSSGQWMQQGSGCDGASNTPIPYNYTPNTMGGLPALFTQPGIGGVSYIVPLSSTNLQTAVVVSSDGSYSALIPTADTIMATNPSVATPVGATQQTATIQAEQSAYAGQ